MPEVKDFGAVKVIKVGDAIIVAGVEFEDEPAES